MTVYQWGYLSLDMNMHIFLGFVGRTHTDEWTGSCRGRCSSTSRSHQDPGRNPWALRSSHSEKPKRSGVLVQDKGEIYQNILGQKPFNVLFYDQMAWDSLFNIESLLFISDGNSETRGCHQHHGPENISHWNQYGQIHTTVFGNRTPVPLSHGQWYEMGRFCGDDSLYLCLSMTLFWICVFLLL